jgi:N-acyl-D-aspartate/D-glutamate deacylase
MDLELVIANGKIVDGTGRARFRAVLIKGQVVARGGQMVGNGRWGQVLQR